MGEHPDPNDLARLREELQAVPKPQRLDFLADLPPARQAVFKRILSREDIRKLNEHLDRRVRTRARPSYEVWIAEARAGRATTPDAMIEVLSESTDRMRPEDAAWIKRITLTASGRSFTKRQEQVIRGIYARYYGPQAS